MESGLDVEPRVLPAAEPPHPPPPKPRRRRRRSWWARIGLILAALIAVPLNLAVIGTVGAAAFVAVALAGLPEIDALRDVRLQEPLRVYSADGALMAEFGVERRRPVALAEVPPRLIDAFLATEDSRFFEHHGIDTIGLARAAISLVQTGERTQGGSTITMQVARNFFLTPEKTFRRKLAELLLAVRIERSLSKDEILELYLNKIFFGHRAYGVSAAAAVYYNKELPQLSLAQMAMLAGIPKAPSANNPISNPKRALERRNYILHRMHELGQIDAVELAAALSEPDQARLNRRPVDLDAGYAAEMVRMEMLDRYGEAAYTEGFRVTTTIDSRLQRKAQEALRGALRDYDRRHGYRGPEGRFAVKGARDGTLDEHLAGVRALPGLTAGIVVRADAGETEVYIGGGSRVTLGLKAVEWAARWIDEDRRGRAPRKVSDAVATGDLVRLYRDEKGAWELSANPKVDGALVALSPLDGAIYALVGGNYFFDSKFNRAVDARRQPGSSFKPIVYAAALAEGWTPASLVRDERISIRIDRNKLWEPSNFDHKTMGPIRMRQSLVLSRNLASIYLLERVGLDDARAFAENFGFDLRGKPVGLSLALGTAEASPVQMAGAYAVFANGGFRVRPHFITRVENAAGERVFESAAPRACDDCWYRYPESPAETLPVGGRRGPEAERVLDPRLVFQMSSLMQDVIREGTGRKALELKRSDIAGKTGTTNEVRDSWFCGYQRDLVTVTWMGFDDFSPLGRGETGGQAALGMWVDFMREALAGKPEATLEVPPGMVEVRVDKRRGRPTSSTGSSTLVEWIPEELASAVEGPEPVHFVEERASGAVAPRVIDELF
jgi:penicillin-binding protein 1A